MPEILVNFSGKSTNTTENEKEKSQKSHFPIGWIGLTKRPKKRTLKKPLPATLAAGSTCRVAFRPLFSKRGFGPNGFFMYRGY